MANKKAQISYSRGHESEKIAAYFLTNKGYRLIQKNFRIPGGEIDLIMQKDGILTFVEVKSRAQSHFGTALESITRQKKRLLLRAAATYLIKNKVQIPWQIHVVTIQYQPGNKAHITHYKNIFTCE
ncbi:YraN family protein [Candidatus Peregrinibacteria bacterium]|nr:YraN family protein [Candidatus Peregrinibacteria bacterium]